MSSFWLVRPTPPPWGDYGQVLVHGYLSNKRRRDDEPAKLLRVAPYMPPMTFPYGAVVVTDSFRRSLEAAASEWLAFRPVEKAHISRVDWIQRRFDEDPPLVSSGSREPESFILGRPHDPSAARELGDLWELVVPEWGDPDATVVKRVPRTYEVTLILGPDPAPPIFRDRSRWLYVADAGRSLLENLAREHVTFTPAQIVSEHPASRW